MMNEESVFDLLGHNVHIQHTYTVIVGDEQFFILSVEVHLGWMKFSFVPICCLLILYSDLRSSSFRF